MLQIVENNIKLTKGDDAYLQIVIYDSNNNIYELQDGDKLIFMIKQLPKKDAPSIITKNFQNNQIKLESKDTNFLKSGRYFWFCDLYFKNGDINTVNSGEIEILNYF